MDGQKLILGVDPGLSGALVYYNLETKLPVSCFDMPITKGAHKKRIDPYELAIIIDAHAKRTKFVVIEDVHSMPRDGHVGAFSFGVSKGLVIGAAAAVMLPMRMVAPAVWKMAMGLSSDKSASIAKATGLFPEFAATYLKRKKDDGRAEALLMAVYAARSLERK